MDIKTNYYKALLSHDARFDGRFFVGVTSTHIYCRPICRVKVPQEKNCLFFPNAAAAENAGFRPCMRCRPELAPGTFDRGNSIATRVAKYIENGFLQDQNLADLANILSLSERHLRRIFQNYWGVSPVEYSQTQKLLLAKQLLTETKLSVTTVAFSAGFSSLSRFNELLKKRYKLSPRQLRKQVHKSVSKKTLQLFINYRKPFAWQEHLAFLERRAIPGVEIVDNDSYSRTVLLIRNRKIYKGWITVGNDPKRVRLIVTMPEILAPVTALVLARVKQLFDTNCLPDDVATQLGTLAHSPQGLRVPGAFDGFEIAVRAILGQQITVGGARTLAGRIASALGEDIVTEISTIKKISPSPEQIIAAGKEQLKDLGITEKRAQTIIDLAYAVVDKKIVLTSQTNVHETIKQLLAINGIGSWTAQYIAMRALEWPDAFPSTDYGIKKALGETNEKIILEKAKRWQPWRAYAVMYLWNKLSKGGEK